MRIDNPINPNQDVRSHLFDGDTWSPAYRASGVKSLGVEFTSTDNITIVTPESGKRVVVMGCMVLCSIGVASTTGILHQGVRIMFESSGIIYGTTFAFDTNGLTGNQGPVVLQFPGGLDIGLADELVVVNSTGDITAASYVFNIIYTQV